MAYKNKNKLVKHMKAHPFWWATAALVAVFSVYLAFTPQAYATVPITPCVWPNTCG